jgi:hypothetical protein
LATWRPKVAIGTGGLVELEAVVVVMLLSVVMPEDELAGVVDIVVVSADKVAARRS